MLLNKQTNETTKNKQKNKIKIIIILRGNLIMVNRLYLQYNYDSSILSFSTPTTQGARLRDHLAISALADCCFS
jgi:hypothetical protein